MWMEPVGHVYVVLTLLDINMQCLYVIDGLKLKYAKNWLKIAGVWVLFIIKIAGGLRISLYITSLELRKRHVHAPVQLSNMAVAFVSK